MSEEALTSFTASDAYR